MKFQDLVFLAEMDYSNIPGEHSQSVRDALRGDDPESFETIYVRVNDNRAPHDFYDFKARAKKAGLKAEIAAETAIDPSRGYYKIALNGPRQALADFVHYLVQLPGIEIE